MRKLLFILLAVLLLPCCVHQPQNGVRSLLKEAEGMIRTSPDTAYFLLREMETTMDLETEADSAYHGLLLLEAQTKNGMKLTDTTRLQSLIHYYQEQQDSLMQVRLLRLRAVAYRDGGHYNEAVRCYNATIDKAKRIDEKRWLADMYQELAHLHYSGFLILGTDSCKRLSDSLYNLTIQTAKELGDSVLWMKSLITPLTVPKHREEVVNYEHRLLQALDLSVALKDQNTEAVVSMYLSMVYSEKGKSDESLLYAKRNLSLRKGTIPEYLYCLTLGNAFQRIGHSDSASYYLNKGDELKGKESLSQFFASSSRLSNKGDIRLTEIFVERLKQKDGQGRERERELYMYVLLWIAVSVAVIVFLVYLVGKSRKKHQEEEELRKVSEELRRVLEKEKTKLKAECLSVQALLLQKDEDLKRQKDEFAKNLQKISEIEEQLKQTEETLQKEKETLLCKENEIKSLQLQMEQFVSDTSRVLDKIKRMVADFRHKDSSELKMEEKDWALLLLAMDKKEGGVITRIRHEYQLSDMEVRLLCLHLAGVATAQIFLFLGISRNTLYGKNNELLCKMGIKRTSSTFKKDIQDFLKNRK